MNEFAFKILPLPGLGLMESRILRKLVDWGKAYEQKKSQPKINGRAPHPPTTEECSKHFNVQHDDMLKLLNRLEKLGLVAKTRRQSAGLRGDGYDGALYSSVLPTEKAVQLVCSYGR